MREYNEGTSEDVRQCEGRICEGEDVWQCCIVRENEGVRMMECEGVRQSCKVRECER